MVNLKTRLVKPNFQIMQLTKEKSIIEYIDEKVNGLDVTALKLDSEFIKFIAEIIENYNEKDKKEEKIDKLNVFKTVYKKMFKDLSPLDEKMAIIILESLLKHKLIKKTPLTKVMIFYLKKACGAVSD